MWRDVGQQEKEFAMALSAPSTAKGSFKTSLSLQLWLTQNTEEMPLKTEELFLLFLHSFH